MRALTGNYKAVDVDAMVNQAKADMAQRLTQSLLSLAGGANMGSLAGSLLGGGNGASPAAGANGSGAAAAGGAWEPVWIDSPACTACDECTQINPKIFMYNGQKQATIKDPKGGPYRDIVKAAEKCTAGCIHPGTPWNATEKDVDKLVKRAAKYQ